MKRRRYFVDGQQGEPLYAGTSIADILEFLKHDFETLNQDLDDNHPEDGICIVITSRMMTDEELNALPEY